MINIPKEKSKSLTILVTGIGGDIGQSVIKCLRDSHYELYLIGCDIDSYAGGQQDVDVFYQAPYASQTKEYLNFITNVIKKKKCEYIIPTTEQEIEFYDANRTHFEINEIKILINNSFIINTFSNKYKTFCFLKKHDFLYPETYKLFEFNNELEFPVIIKKEIGSGGKGIYICHNDDELIYFKNMCNDDEIVQEIIGNPDEEYTIGIFSDGSSVQSIAFRRYLDYGGRTKVAELIKDNKIDLLARNLARACKLIGSINLQVRKTENGFVTFEINPRLSSTVYFRHFFGFRDVEWWLNIYEGYPTEFIPKYNKGIAVRTFDEIFIGLE